MASDQNLQKAEEIGSPRLQRCEDRLKSLIALSSDWYWEQDEHFRFILFMGEALDKTSFDRQRMLGTARWEHDAVPLGDGGTWDAHKAMLAARLSFTDFIYQTIDAQRAPHYVSVSGRPAFDAHGQFTGYRGIAKDVTERVQIERRLNIERAAARILAGSNSIGEALPQIIRVICEALGWTCGARWELDERCHVLRCAETWSTAAAGVDDFIESMKQTPSSARTAKGGWSGSSKAQTAWIHDIAEEPNFPHAADALKVELHSAFTFPIRAGARVIGIVAFFGREIYQPDKELLECATYIGAQIGQFWQRTRAEERLREIGDRFQSLTEMSSDWYWEQDENFRFTERAGGPQHRAELRPEETLGKTRWELPYVDVSEEQWTEHKAILAARKPFQELVLKRRREDGSVRHISISGRPFFDDNGNFKGYRGIGKDITDQKIAEERIHYIATHDALTALPNRVMFSEILNVAINSARRYRRGLALLFIDLDGFKNINDSLGHDNGDNLLREMGKRLMQSLRDSDVVARMGGDEFVVLLQEINEPEHIVTVARKLLAVIVKPMVLLGEERRISASIGVSMYPQDAEDERGLLKDADIAMYRAKDQGKNNFSFFSA